MPITEIIALTCDGCTVDSSAVVNGYVDVAVSRADVGTATLDAHVRMEDGSQRREHTTVRFALPAEIRLRCGVYPSNATCPGEAYGAFVGARWAYWPIARGGGYDLDMPVTVTFEGTAIARASSSDDTVFGFSAIEPGIAHVTFTALGAEHAFDVRVASVDEVTSITLRPSINTFYGSFAPDPNEPRIMTGSAPTWMHAGAGTMPFYLVSTLSDGTQVLGGLATYESSQPDVVTIGPHYPIAPTDGWWELSFRAGNVGSAIVTVSLGSATATYPIDVVP